MQPASPSSSSSVFPLSDKLREKLMGKATEQPFAPPELTQESLWETQAAKSQGPTTTKPVSSPSRSPAPPNMSVPSRTSASFKSIAPSKLNTTMSGDVSDTTTTSGHRSSRSIPSGSRTSSSSTYAGAYSYISPVFFEMEDEEFPRVDDLLPDEVVEDTIRRFYGKAAEMDIELRRNITSGGVDDSRLEQLLNSHVAAMERNARKILEEWASAREAAAEQKRVEEQRALDEQRQRQAEARKFIGKRGKRLGLPIIEDVAEEHVPVELPAQAKKKQAKRGAASNQANVREETNSVMTAPPSLGPEGEGSSFWQPQPKVPVQAGAAKSMFSFFGKPSQSPAPEPPVSSPWPQTQPAPLTPSFSGKSPFSSVPRVNDPIPELTPWEAMRARKQDPAQLKSQPDPWTEYNTDKFEEGVTPWTRRAVDSARNGAASAWNLAMSAVSGERPGTTVPRPSTVIPGRENMWGSGDAFARSESRVVWPEESSAGADPRFATWQPPKKAPPEVDNDNPAKKMMDLAFENLIDVADDNDDPSQLLTAMSMYTKATGMANSTRKRGGSNVNR